MRVTLVNHSFIASENQKNLSVLSEGGAIQAISPDRYVSGENSIWPEPDQKRFDFMVWKKAFFYRNIFLLSPFGTELATHQPDVIHIEYSPWSPITIQTIILAKRYVPNAKIILTMKKNTYLPLSPLKEALKSNLRRWVDKRVDGYMATSMMVRNLCIDFLGIEESRIFNACHLGVDLDVFKPDTSQLTENSPLTIGFVGRLHSRKGVPELVDAVQSLNENNSNKICLRLLGEGPLKGSLEKKAKDLDWLSIEGPVPHIEVATFLQGCHIFALPSRNEPDHQEHDAHALMEAMAVGLPSVTTRSGMITEITNSETTAFVDENSAYGLAQAFKELQNNPKKREMMGKHARQIALNEFGLITTNESRFEIYRSLVNLKRR